MQKRQSYPRETKQVRIDAGLHKLLKVEAAEAGRTIKHLLDECVEEHFEVKRGQ